MGQDGVDLSFTDALNLREVERIDRAVNEANGCKSAQEGKTCHSEATPQKWIAQDAGFDESEAEGMSEPTEVGEENWPSDIEQDEAFEVENANGIGQRRRLSAKTNPAGTGYTERPLLTRVEYLIRKRKVKNKIRMHQAEVNAARKKGHRADGEAGAAKRI